MRLDVCALVLLACCLASSSRAEESLRVEVQRRHAALIEQGFNVTYELTVAAESTRLELFVPPSDDPHVVSLWFAADAGLVHVRVTDPTGEVVVGLDAARVDRRIVTKLAPGRYVVEASGARGEGLVGVKGDVVVECALDGARVTEHAPARGFHWPYLLVAAKSKRATGLLVLPNNTGFASEDPALLRASATCDARAALEMADRLGVAILVPMFPRPAQPGANLYLHALTRAALETKTPAFARVDLQLVAMIDDAQRQLPERVGARALLQGFSASGSFVNRFAMLHPDRVLAVAVGSPGGWPIAPVFDDPALTYPVGLADVQRLTGARVDLPALRRVDFLFMLGSADENDSVPYRDSFSKGDEALVLRRFGKTPVARWKPAAQLYEAAKLRATFKLYEGEGHTLAPSMRSDEEALFRHALDTR